MRCFMQKIEKFFSSVRHFVGKSRFYNRLLAENLASGSKRLDLCCAQIAEILYLSGLAGKSPIRDKVCLELGSGWVLSHSCVLHLLGAKKIIATDVSRIAYPAVLHKSIHDSVDFIVQDVLASFEEHEAIRRRLDNLLKIKNFSFDTLEKLEITYFAPIDLASKRLDTKVDFIYSTSVLEHVPTNDILPLFKNLSDMLSEGGVMIHCIHLEDHKDFRNTPFDFLCEPEEKFTREIQGARGNRLRKSQWQVLLSELKDIQFKIILEWKRTDKDLPSIIDPSIHYKDEDDLRTSHLAILCKKI